MTRTTALLAVALAGLTACGGDKVSPPATSSFAFTYAGDLSGSFNVTGITGNEGGTGVAGYVESGIAIVMGINDEATSGPMFALIGFTHTATGTLPMTPDTPENDDACLAGTMNCAAMSFIVSATVGGTMHSYTCTLTSGSLTLTTSTATRSAGTFAGAGVCEDMESGLTTTAITVSGGSFSTTFSANPLGGF